MTDRTMTDRTMCVDNGICEGECPSQERTMRDNVDELNMLLVECNDIMEKFSGFLWSENFPDIKEIEVKSFDTAIVFALVEARYLRERLLSVVNRMGMQNSETTLVLRTN